MSERRADRTPPPGSCPLAPSNPTNPTCTSAGPLLLAQVEADLLDREMQVDAFAWFDRFLKEH